MRNIWLSHIQKGEEKIITFDHSLTMFLSNIEPIMNSNHAMRRRKTKCFSWALHTVASCKCFTKSEERDYNRIILINCVLRKSLTTKENRKQYTSTTNMSSTGIMAKPGIPNIDMTTQTITSAIIDTSNVLLGFDFQKALRSLAISIAKIPESNSMSKEKVCNFDNCCDNPRYWIPK